MGRQEEAGFRDEETGEKPEPGKTPFDLYEPGYQSGELDIAVLYSDLRRVTSLFGVTDEERFYPPPNREDLASGAFNPDYLIRCFREELALAHARVKEVSFERDCLIKDADQLSKQKKAWETSAKQKQGEINSYRLQLGLDPE
jgi:hypothetical protein